MNKPCTGANPRVHAELIKAWADGAEIEFLSKVDGEWRYTDTPDWHPAYEFRVKPTVTHKIGNIYRFYDGTKQMLTCFSDHRVVMIAISGSLCGRLVDEYAEKVEDIWNITEEEFEAIVGGNPDDYILIESND